MSSRRQMLEFLSLSRLPAEFQEVEYFESTGTQYIDSGVIANSNIKLVFYVSVENTQTAGFTNQFSVGCRQSYLNKDFHLSLNGYLGGGNYSRISFVVNDSIYSNDTINTNNINKYEIVAGIYSSTLYVNDSLLITANKNFNANLNLFIFGFNSGGTVAGLGNGAKIYSCKIYDNSILVRNFVPCYRKADNVAGLYDLVNGVFYTNAGTGTFIVGGNV